jgi:hypothetical protein
MLKARLKSCLALKPMRYSYMLAVSSVCRRTALATGMAEELEVSNVSSTNGGGAIRLF